MSHSSVPEDTRLRHELLEAARTNNLDYAQRLFKFDFDKSAVDGDGSSAVILATENKSQDMLSLLLQNGSSVNVVNKKGQAALHIAAEIGDIDLVKCLIQYRADTELEIPSVGTAALIACKRGFADILSILLEGKASPNATSGGETVLSTAVEQNDISMTQIILQHHPSFEITDINGYTSLMRASQKGYTEIVRLLLSGKANANFVSKDGTSAMYLADFMGHANVVNLLTQFGAVSY